MEQDFTTKYNTELSDKQEARFREWAAAESERQGRDVLKDLYDYDLRGLWLEKGGFEKNGHASDKYKKPNHMTFSRESIYSGRDGYVGGEWKHGKNGWSFTASDTNQQFHARRELEDYFKEAEPDSVLYFHEGEQAIANRMFE